MDVMVAIEAVKFYLARIQGTFLICAVREIEQGFCIAVQQLSPSMRQRTFDFLPEDVADCWKLVEA